jgi:hypothetical protein
MGINDTLGIERINQPLFDPPVERQIMVKGCMSDISWLNSISESLVL